LAFEGRIRAIGGRGALGDIGRNVGLHLDFGGSIACIGVFSGIQPGVGICSRIAGSVRTSV
jgi:hypothetical protein